MAYHQSFQRGSPPAAFGCRRALTAESRDLKAPVFVMTMLDRMRRHRDWLKWSLGLVCVAFVLFYIPDFLHGTGADAAAGDTIAKVEGQEITAGDFRRTYQAQLQQYRSADGASMSH